ncbi:hypothetical protein TcG_02290 [Trypanosoma cruzi]|nr:hypothetical protein TcG_02290 [Trypanosoma cruzi]
MSLVNRELSLIRTRPGLLRQRSSFLTVVESSRRGVFFSHNSPSNESAPRSLVRGERYSQSLEAQLLHFGRQMKFKSSLWITEKERQDEGLKLRSALEIPFSCPCTEGMKPVAFIVNAAFVEQTDLFFSLCDDLCRCVVSAMEYIGHSLEVSGAQYPTQIFPSHGWKNSLHASITCCLMRVQSRHRRIITPQHSSTVQEEK